MLKAYLLDDEALAVKRLQRLLHETSEVDVVGSSVDPVIALQELKDMTVDVLFLDIEMPGLNGFEFLQALGGAGPFVIFTTAFHQYALQAFEVNSIDYLLKPVELHHLRRALTKLRRIRGGFGPRPDVQQLLSTLQSVLSARKSPEYPERLPSRLGERVEFVDVHRVTHFYAKDKLTFAATEVKDFCMEGSIVDLENRLDPKRFIRIHRSTLVNVDYIHELYSWFGGRVLLRLKDEKKTELTVARDRVKPLKERLNL